MPARSQGPQEAILARLQPPGPGVCPLPPSPQGLCAPRSCPASTSVPLDSPTNGLGSPSPDARANREPWEHRRPPQHGVKRLTPSLSRQKLFPSSTHCSFPPSSRPHKPGAWRLSWAPLPPTHIPRAQLYHFSTVHHPPCLSLSLPQHESHISRFYSSKGANSGPVHPAQSLPSPRELFPRYTSQGNPG